MRVRVKSFEGVRSVAVCVPAYCTVNGRTLLVPAGVVTVVL